MTRSPLLSVNIEELDLHQREQRFLAWRSLARERLYEDGYDREVAWCFFQHERQAYIDFCARHPTEWMNFEFHSVPYEGTRRCVVCGHLGHEALRGSDGRLCGKPTKRIKPHKLDLTHGAQSRLRAYESACLVRERHLSNPWAVQKRALARPPLPRRSARLMKIYDLLPREIRPNT